MAYALFPACADSFIFIIVPLLGIFATSNAICFEGSSFFAVGQFHPAFWECGQKLGQIKQVNQGFAGTLRGSKPQRNLNAFFIIPFYIFIQDPAKLIYRNILP